VAIVTGAARGSGAAIARRFVAEGAQVWLGDVLEPEGRRWRHARRARALRAARRHAPRGLAEARRGRARGARPRRRAREQRGAPPPRREAPLDQIAQAVVFFASDASLNCTGVGLPGRRRARRPLHPRLRPALERAPARSKDARRRQPALVVDRHHVDHVELEPLSLAVTQAAWWASVSAMLRMLVSS
jgi:NAD(P)-dependent dehydrogenase (short-subunit alcohol dehydrogenase family)